MTSALRRDVYVVKEGYAVAQQRDDLLEIYHISIRWFTGVDDCLETLGDHPCSLLIVGLDDKPDTGLRLLTQSKQMYPLMHRIAVVNRGDVHMTVRAMTAGAHECVEQPIDGEWWLTAIERGSAEWQMKHLRSNGTLTETEKFVLSQVLEGKTSKEIGWILHRSPRTVEVHRTHIIQKLGVSSTVDLIRQAVAMESQDSIP